MIVFLYFFSLVVVLLYAIVLLVPAFYFSFSRKEKKTGKVFSPVISIILPVRNEEKNIASCLESLDALDYPKELYEIILIDDHSTDRTKSIAQQFSKLMPSLQIVEADENSSGKKKAITAGIKKAKGEIIAATDGDCIVPPDWLNEIANAFAGEEIIFAAGPVAYKKKNSLLRDFLSIEQIILQSVSAGAMQMRFPLMCSGANLAYRKKFFEASGGYENDHFASGDDMMLMLKAAKAGKRKMKFLQSKKAIVLTSPADSLSETISQRARWSSKFSVYKSSFTGVAGMTVFTANFMLLVMAVICLWQPAVFPVLLSAFCGKMLIDLLLLSLAVPFFGEPRLLLLAPAGGLFYPILSSVSALAGLTRSFSWKGRKWKT
jgi:cellulose synthase/poly-beta-1,6-N-acetylglucosamine synthase-like glycosyltransferase